MVVTAARAAQAWHLVCISGGATMPSPKMEFHHYKNKGVQREAPQAVFVSGDPRRQYDEVFRTRTALGASIHWFPAYNDGVQGEVSSHASAHPRCLHLYAPSIPVHARFVGRRHLHPFCM